MKASALALGVFAMVAGCADGGSEGDGSVADVSPALATYTDELVLGEVWSRPDLSRRDRSLVTVAALVAIGQLPELRFHLALALDHGLSPLELSEIVTHLAFYSGWPNGIEAAGVVREVFASRKIELGEPPDLPPLELEARQEAARKAAVAASAGRVSPGLADYTDRVLFGEVWRRAALAPRDRSLVTVAALIATGQAEQLPFHLQRALDHGLTEPQASEVLTQLAFTCGWPRAFSAVGPMQAVFERRRLAEESVPDHLTVTRFEDGESFAGPPDRFTGDVLVESRFAAYPPGRVGGAMVRFEAGARTAWHSHPLGQVLVVTSGVGWVQSEGKERTTVRPGDVVRIPPNVRHWHGASADRAMSHLAVLESLDGVSTHWMELVSDETYLGEAGGPEQSSGVEGGSDRQQSE